MTKTRLFFAFVVLLIVGGAAVAAELSCPRCNENGLYIHISGEIEPGDLARMQAGAAQFPNPKDMAVRLVGINSPGGDVSEAMKIGRWIRKHEFAVVADTHCASACIFVLAAGVNRFVPPNTAIVIHRPYLLELPPDGSLQEKMRELLTLSKDYLAEMNIPDSLAVDMFSIDPSKGRTLSSQAIAEYRLDQEDLVSQEENQLKGAQKRGLSRREYLERLGALHQSGAVEECGRRYEINDDIDKLVVCQNKAHERFGLGVP